MVPLGIGLLVLVAGVVALFMSFSNSSAVKDLATLKDTISAASNKAADAKTKGRQICGQGNANPRVILHVTAVTRVLVQGKDGMTYINRTLQPGDVYRLPDIVGLTLTTPNGGAVEIELDGQMIGTAGKTSQMTEALSLDPQALVDTVGKTDPQ